MKKLILVIGFLLIYLNIHSQSGWFQQYYFNSFIWNNSFYFKNLQTGWMLGDQGLFETTNGGNNWNLISGTNANISSICFVNENTGWKCTGRAAWGSPYGNIYKTTNAGINWSVQQNPVVGTLSNSLLSIKFVNENTGFTCGFIQFVVGQAFQFDAYILKTTNGGTNWIEKLRVTRYDDDNWFRKIDFINENTGWACGDYGLLYLTTNGGENWNSKFYQYYSRFYDLYCPTSNTVYLFYNKFFGYPSYNLILKSTNLGNNFVTLCSTSVSKMRSINFIDSNTGWICGDSNFICKTTNGGINWFNQNIPFNFNYSVIYFKDIFNGWCLSSSSYLLKTTSGGVTFANHITQNTTDQFKLFQNFPNPFNPSTNIKFQIKDSRFVSLIIFDILGKEIETLVNKKLSPGSYNVDWNASQYPSGVYFYKITTDGFSNTKRMLLIK